MKKILILEDSQGFLVDLVRALERWGYQAMPAETVEQAIPLLEQQPDFAIVDLFLAGNSGDHLSNDFIAEYLVPRNIPYCRLTSAPSLVPEEFFGAWVMHKQTFLDDEAALHQRLIEALSE